MSDTRLAQLLAEHEYATSDYVVIHSCNCGPGVAWRDYASYARHLAEVIAAQFLVVPHSDIVGMEYGWRHWLDDGRECVHPAKDPAHALAGARMDSVFSPSDALERPVLPEVAWSVIPLPEDGEAAKPKCPNLACRDGRLPPPRPLQGYATQILCPDCNPRPLSEENS